MRAVRRILALGLFVAVLVVGWRLATENSATVSIHYVAGETGAEPQALGLLAAAIPIVAGFVIDTVQSELTKDAARYEAQFGSVVYHDSFWTIQSPGPDSDPIKRRQLQHQAYVADAKAESMLDIDLTTIDVTNLDTVLQETWNRALPYINKSVAAQKELQPSRLKPTFAGFELIRRTSNGTTSCMPVMN